MAVSDGFQDEPLRDAAGQRRFATVRSVSALILREMSTSYGRSPIGYLWEILQPVAGITLLTLVFSAMLSSPPVGKSFVLFYTSGMVPFMMYMALNVKVAQSLQFSKSLLVYPSVTVVDAIAGRFILNYLTQCLVAFILFAGVMFFEETRTSLNLGAILLGLVMVGALTLGVGVLNAFLFGVSKGWSRVWTVLNRPLFLISGALFIFEDIPEPYRTWIWYNPLTHVIGQIRRGFYPFYEAEYVSGIYVFSLSAVMTVMGLLFLRRYALEILNN